MKPSTAVDIDGLTGEVLDLPPKLPPLKRAKLDTLAEIKREMCRIYRLTRSERMSSQEASRLVWLLQAIARVTVDSDIEKRIEALENLTK